MSDDKKTRAAEARVSTGDTQYDYVDNTAEANPVTPLGARSTEATSAELNPAFYPKAAKPEALHNEAEQAGADYPGGTQLQAAMMAGSDEDLDPNDPAVANPPAPGAPLGVQSAEEQSTGNGPREASTTTRKTAAKKTTESKDSSNSSK